MPAYREIKQCRCCGSERLWPYLHLGMQPLANSYHKGETLDRFPLDVALCRDCFHSQLTIAVEPSVMFRHYLYVSGTTSTFRNHCDELAKDAVRRHPLTARVLDIACNDGTLLECFRNLGCDVVGVDPAENLREITKTKRIEVEVDYWSAAVAERVGKVDIITATNVLAHVDDAAGFLAACKAALHPDGIAIIEVPYASNMILKCEFDTIYHEHVSYFLINSFRRLADRSGFTIVEIIKTPIHGGSIRFILSPDTEGGLQSQDTYKSFADQVRDNGQRLRDLIEEARSSGRKVIGYGASAKGNTMLNHYQLKLDYIVDDNPMKWGYLTPGMNIPIRDPKDISDATESLAIVILSWNFSQEIIQKIARLRPGQRGDRCILYVPEAQSFDLPVEGVAA